MIRVAYLVRNLGKDKSTKQYAEYVINPKLKPIKELLAFYGENAEVNRATLLEEYVNGKQLISNIKNREFEEIDYFLVSQHDVAAYFYIELSKKGKLAEAVREIITSGFDVTPNELAEKYL
jgi:hypothetical protein